MELAWEREARLRRLALVVAGALPENLSEAVQTLAYVDELLRTFMLPHDTRTWENEAAENVMPFPHPHRGKP
jgi:hypothetical protein